MIIRIVLLAATAVGGVIASRRALNRKIEERLPTEIETATAAASAEIDRKIDDVARERLTALGLALLIKAGVVGAIYLLYAAGHLSVTGLRIAVGGALAAFLVRDLVKVAPVVQTGFSHVRRHRWSVRRALSEFVASVVFERAYEEAHAKTESPENKFWLGLSKYSAHDISNEVAEAVAEVARSTSFERIRARAFLAGGAATVMMALYSIMIAMMLRAT